MARYWDENRRPSTIYRDNNVLRIYRQLMQDLGPLRYEVSRTYIYERIKAETGLCLKTIANILNNCI